MQEHKITIPESEIKTFSLNLFLRGLFHSAFLVLHICVSIYGVYVWYNITEEQTKDEDVYSVKYYVTAYFTNWNYAFQTIFLMLALTHDALEWTSRHSSSFGLKIKYARDVIFNAMVVPYTAFVTSMFWSLYWIDRELVFPEVLDEIAPWWFNHCIHTNISILLVVETLLQARRWPTNKKLELTLNGTIAVGYAVVYYTIFFTTGHWLYKVFGVMTWWQVCIYQLGIWAFSFLVYYLQYPINRAIHGSDILDNKIANEVTEIYKTNTETTEPVDNKLENETKQNGVSKENGAVKENGKLSIDTKLDESNYKNGVSITSFKNGDPMEPFATKSWSLKYRSIRNQFEQNSL